MHYPIPAVAEDAETHHAKRTKLSEPAEEPSIASRVKSRTYNNVEEAAADIDTVISTIVDEFRQMAAAANEQRLSTHTVEFGAEIAKALAFKKGFDNLILRERIQRPRSLTAKRDGEKPSQKSFVADSTKRPALENNDRINDRTGARAVLTLYGGVAPQPRQLFSSLQQPVGIDKKPENLQRDDVPIANASDYPQSTPLSVPSGDLTREHGLPNGISITKVVPVHSANSSDGIKKKIPTLGELFPPPATLPPHNPPKQSRNTATRSSSVNWYNASESVSTSRPHRRDSYGFQPLSTGQWLTYNMAPFSTQLSSPEAKRKQRDRALSFGEPQSTVSQETIVAHRQVKEDALFRSVYSSFAPDRDNTGALIPDHTKNRLWWKRIGETRYRNALESSYPPLDEEEVMEVNGAGMQDSAMEDEFKVAVENWVPEGLPSELKETKDVVPKTPETSKEVDEILEGISDLLETLNSYQRIRNISLASNSRTMANPPLVSMPGSPTSPSAAEFDVFAMLQSQLALMVSTLPPFALAKLDGDKLGVLKINKKIQIQDKLYTGTLEGDEATAKAKQAPATPAASYPPRTVNPNLSLPARSSTYLHATATPTQPVQRPNYATQPRPLGTATTYLPNQQYSSRPASANHYFTGTSQSSYPSQRPISTTSERYSYSASQQYGQRPSQTSHSQQSNGYRSYSAQNGPSYSQQYSTPQHGALSASTQTPGSHTQRPSQPGYQQRALNAHSAKDASPPKAANAAFTPPVQRPPYSGQGSIPPPPRPPIYQQHSVQYGSQTSVPRQVNGSGTVPTSSQHTYMTAEEQSALMNRQKAQLAEQHHSAARQGSGTPAPAHRNYSEQPNGTPVVQQNGVAAGQGH